MSNEEPSNAWQNVDHPESRPATPTFRSDLISGSVPNSRNEPPTIATKSVSWREPFAVLLTVALTDATIYRGAGFAGIAVLLVGLVVLLWFGVSKPKCSVKTLLFTVLVFLAAGKLIWCGFGSTVAAGAVAVLIFGALQAGIGCRISKLFAYPFRSIFSGGARLNDYGRFLSKRSFSSAFASLAFILPLGALLVFGTIFVLANPDLVEMVRKRLADLGDFLSRFTDWLPDTLEVPFWVLCAWVVAGLLNPLRLFAEDADRSQPASTPSAPGDEAGKERSPYYAACRNTLLTVIVLFTVYLVFEFKTLWFRKFPEGFCYSGYSHEGAAWLTVALGVSTVILSSIFRGTKKQLGSPWYKFSGIS